MTISPHATGFMITIGFYVCFSIFLATYILKALTWGSRGKLPKIVRPGDTVLKTFIFSVADVLLLRRLFIANPKLWFGEWLFHACFVMVAVRHLRFILDPAPSWLESLQTPCIIAGYLLPLSLFYIMIMKFLIEKKDYFSTSNFVLLVLILLIISSGFLMRFVFLTDLVAVKEFSHGIFAFVPASFPESVFFGVHFSFFMILVLLLPTHIFAAPFVMMDARFRQENLRRVMHDD